MINVCSLIFKADLAILLPQCEKSSTPEMTYLFFVVLAPATDAGRVPIGLIKRHRIVHYDWNDSSLHHDDTKRRICDDQ